MVGNTHVLTDPAVTAGYLTDWTGRFRGASGVVLRPGSLTEVCAVLAVCNSHGVSVVPQGGNTGLVGGGVPHRGEVVLSLRRLADPPIVEPAAGFLTASAGVTIADVQRAAAAAGLRYRVDLASRESATVGGTIATNAGGLRVGRFGDTRAQLLGVQVVLADGRVVSALHGLSRDNTGYHLPSLVAGSEGTLAVVTAAQLQIAPREPSAAAIVGCRTTRDAVAVAQAVRMQPAVSAVELMLGAGMRLVRQHAGLQNPLAEEYAAYLLVEAETSRPVEDLAAAIDIVPGVSGVAVADDPAGCAKLWMYRERHTEAIATLGTAVKMDVTLPSKAAADIVTELPTAVAAVAESARTWLFGHIGDGNVHVNVTGLVNQGDAETVQDIVFRLVTEAGGSISTEHGIGWAKRPWLHLTRSSTEIDLLRQVKTAFDPNRILNPNALFPE